MIFACVIAVCTQLVPATTTLRVRMLDSLTSVESSVGHTLRAVVMRPLVLDGRTVVDAGSTITGVTTAAGTLREKGRQYFVTVTFSTLTTRDGTTIPFPARIVDVINAREYVDTAGRVIGPPLQSMSKSASTWALAALGMVEPIPAIMMMAAFRGEQQARHRDIRFAPGTDLVIRALAPVTAAESPGNGAELAALVDDVTAQRFDTLLAQLPRRTAVRVNGPPSDFLNAIFVGSDAQIDSAFRAAGWSTAEKISARSDFRTFWSALRGKGDEHQPVSTQVAFGRLPDLVYQRVVDTFAKRHHVRLWRSSLLWNGQSVWIAAATRDIGVRLSAAHRGFTHRTDPEIDDERNVLVEDLQVSGGVQALSLVPSINSVHEYFAGKVRSDGRVAVIVLAPRPQNGIRFGRY